MSCEALVDDPVHAKTETWGYQPVSAILIFFDLRWQDPLWLPCCQAAAVEGHHHAPAQQVSGRADVNVGEAEDDQTEGWEEQLSPN